MERTIKKSNSKGTELEFIFELNDQEGELALTDVRVKGLSVMENLDPDLLQEATNEMFHRWIMEAI